MNQSKNSRVGRKRIRNTKELAELIGVKPRTWPAPRTPSPGSGG